MADRQKTIASEVNLEGVGLHTGSRVRMTLRPAPEDTGIWFRRTDLAGTPQIRAIADNVLLEEKVPRCTSLGRGEQAIHTVEHFMSVLCGLGVDNLFVDIDGNELPGLDGSGRDYLKAVKEAGLEEQSRDRAYFILREPLSVSRDDSSILVVPHEKLDIAYTLLYEGHPFLKGQCFHARVNDEVFEREIAPCRTFCLEAEAEQLRQAGLGKGADYKNTLVVGDQGVIQNEVRFPDEFARHKVLDCLGDLYLLGQPLKARIFAFRSGHTLNLTLLKQIARQRDFYQKTGSPDSRPIIAGDGALDIQAVRKILPHRYPFLMVDRVLETVKGKRIRAVKNVTANEPFFEGHFPTRPVMPGVLMVEAMAQAGGILVLSIEAHQGQVAFFMAADKVKFRKVVEPGDQLILEVELLRDRSRTAQLKGVARVGDEVVVEAEMVFSFTPASYLAV